MIEVKLHGFDEKLAQLKGLKLSVKSGTMVAANAAANFLRAHLREKNAAEPNAIGGKRTNFWADVARSVNKPVPVADQAAVILVTHPAYPQKVYGGPIVPKTKKWLTIPASPVAHGERARSFNLKFAIVDGRPALVSQDQFSKSYKTQKRTDGKVSEVKQKIDINISDVIFWLVKKVNQKPWPGSMPDQQKLEVAAGNALSEWIDRKTNQEKS